MAAAKILVVGATGKQGGAIIKYLLSSKSPSIEIFGLTRNAESGSSKALADKGVKMIQGDPRDPEPIFTQVGQIDRVFLVTVPKDEEAQGMPMIDASIAHGVKHLVFTSVERGGNDKSEDNPTDVPHFASKHRMEKHIKSATLGKSTSWTFLRPVAFMDNLTPDFMGKGFTSMWSGVGDKPLQLISVNDIGRIGAAALLEPHKYAGRAIGLAGDELTVEQARSVFRDTTGLPLPETWGLVGSAIKFMVGEMGKMFEWFRTDGYGVDIAALRREFPDLQDFGTWLKEDGAFKGQ